MPAWVLSIITSRVFMGMAKSVFLMLAKAFVQSTETTIDDKILVVLEKGVQNVPKEDIQKELDNVFENFE